jgi:hypothetical protein
MGNEALSAGDQGAAGQLNSRILMSTTSAWSSVPHDPPSRSDWAARARYAPTDFVTLLWRERWLMLACSWSSSCWAWPSPPP